MKKWKQVLIAVVIVATVLLIFFYGQLNRAIRPMRQARTETIEIAKRKAGLKQAKDFYWFNGMETFFTVTGNDEEGNEMIVIVKQKGGDIITLEMQETITEKEAIRKTIEDRAPKKILEARIGMIEETPIWEISFLNNKGQLGYHILQLKDGLWLSTLENI